MATGEEPGAAVPSAGNAPGMETGVKESAKPTQSTPVLPWMRLPVAFDAGSGLPLQDVQDLDPALQACLQGQGIEELFPVQATVWQEMAGGRGVGHDICIAAPTGSGKTLAYVLPLVSALAASSVRGVLRGLVVVPTRDLAEQVFGVLRPLCAVSGLGAALLNGRARSGVEAALLSGGGVDVAVATPGRLAAHAAGTPGFGLATLRWLVVDECDRLLRQSYQDWLATAIGVGGKRSKAANDEIEEPSEPGVLPAPAPRVVKIIASATLTKDPAKLLRLGLHAPRFLAQTIDADRRYALPPALTQRRLVLPAARKPEALAALLHGLGPGCQAVVFASSVKTVGVLQRLLTGLSGLVPVSVACSGATPPAERRAALDAFRAGHADVLVCSDLVTRGMDLPGVAAVINYDAPVYIKTYVHRAGRTARAGAAGQVFTLLRPEDVRHFRLMLTKAEHGRVADHVLDEQQVQVVRGPVATALERLGDREDLEIEPKGAASLDKTRINAQQGVPGVEALQARAQKPLQQRKKRRRFTGLPVLELVPGLGCQLASGAES